jgi:hypothetical protein
MSDLLITSLSGASTRQAVVEETTASAWLFMTAARGEEPVAHCFLYDTGGEAAEGEPPPIDPEFASGYRVALPVTEDDVEMIWAPDGEAVAVRIHGVYVAFIGPDDLRGYSRAVAADCDWGHPFDVELFNRLFDME